MSPRLGGWRSETGRAAYLAAYAEAMATLPPHETIDIPTAFGTVRAYRFGPPDGARPPVVLLPGKGSGAPMWRANLPALVPAHTVYALDALGDAGRSEQSAPIVSAADQAAWVARALRGLAIYPAHLVGHSFGGWAAVNTALHHPDVVASVTVLDPVLTFSNLRWQMYVASLAMLLPALPQGIRDRAFAYVGGGPVDRDDPVAAMIALGNQSYRGRVRAPRRFSNAELRRLNMPVLAIMAGRSAVNDDPGAAVRLARRTVPRITAQVWPETTHSLPMERPFEIAAAITDFIALRQ